jgi:hypothetical protein
MTQPADFGTDLSSGAVDIDETRTVTGIELVAQDALWRLQTPRGMGILEEDAPDYGIDLLDAIGSVETDSDLAALPDKIEGELTEDPRILTCDAVITRTSSGPAVAYDIKITCETADGRFALVGTSDGVTLDLAVQLLPAAA